MTSRSIHNIAVVGASGNIGSVIVNALLSQGFKVTAVTRESSNATFPSEVAVKRVDLTSKNSLLLALQGQDAVVSVINRVATGGQNILIDAAVQAKVKRFIPSDFGINYSTAGDHKVVKQLEPKLKTMDYLIQLSQKYEWFSWTSLVTNLFFDWGLQFGVLGFNLSTKTATIIDSGDEPFSTTNLGTVGQAVASILSHPDETANKYLTISSFTTTQNEVLKLLESESGVKWQVKNISSTDVERLGDEKKQEGDGSYFLQYLLLYTFADGANHALKEKDSANSLLGLKEEEIRSTIRRMLAVY